MNDLYRLCVRLLVCGLILAAMGPAGAADGPLLWRQDGASQPAELATLSPMAIGVTPVASEPAENDTPTVEEVPLDRLYRWGTLTPPPRRPRVLLHGGSQLIAAPTWTLEGSIQFDGETLSVKQQFLNDASIAKSQLRGVLLEATRDPANYAAVLEEFEAWSAADDRVWLTNGDAYTGRLDSVESGRLSFEAGGESLQFELTQVAAVRTMTLQGSQPDLQQRQPALAIGLRDGGLLLAKAASLDAGGVLSIEMPTGQAYRGRRRTAVTLVQPLGGRVTYLSDLSPIDYRHTPYFGLSWPYAGDRNLFGNRLTASGQPWLKGLAMHSASRLVYRLPADARRFACSIALDDSSQQSSARGGSVLFRVLVARGGRFESAYASPVVRTGDVPVPVAVDIAGAKALALVVEHAGGGDTLDHANWLDARLVR